MVKKMIRDRGVTIQLSFSKSESIRDFVQKFEDVCAVTSGDFLNSIVLEFDLRPQKAQKILDFFELCLELNKPALMHYLRFASKEKMVELDSLGIDGSHREESEVLAISFAILRNELCLENIFKKFSCKNVTITRIPA